MSRGVARTYKYVTPLLISMVRSVVRGCGLDHRIVNFTVEANSAHNRKTAVLLVIDTGRYMEKWLFVASGNEEGRSVSGSRLRRLYAALERIASRVARRVGGVDKRFYIIAYSAPRFTASFRDEAYKLYHRQPDTIAIVRWGANPLAVARQAVERLRRQLASWLQARLEGLRRRLAEVRAEYGITEYYGVVKDLEIVLKRLHEALEAPGPPQPYSV